MNAATPPRRVEPRRNFCAFGADAMHAMGALEQRIALSRSDGPSAAGHMTRRRRCRQPWPDHTQHARRHPMYLHLKRSLYGLAVRLALPAPLAAIAAPGA